MPMAGGTSRGKCRKRICPDTLAAKRQVQAAHTECGAPAANDHFKRRLPLVAVAAIPSFVRRGWVSPRGIAKQFQ